jgi:DNA (cytosine-5)-methyltransferase 1
VLKHHYPKSISYDDIIKTDFTIHRGQIDIITGGFPCQPYSQAGKRLGKEDDRHLWPEMLRVIRQVQPRWVVGENVFGLINWNDGLVFDEVQADLEAEGYEVQPYVLPAVAVNAPHRRDRVWFVAYAESMGWGRRRSKTSSERQDNIQQSRGERLVSCRTTPNPNRNGLHERNSNDEIDAGQRGEYAQRDVDEIVMHTDSTSESGQYIGRTREGQFDRPNSRDEHIGNWQNFPTQPPICGGNDGLPTELHGITFPKWRAESIKAYGNAIVPQVAMQIFKAIQQYEQL